MLYSYKMVVDSGFAPNPFHEYLTLATCKPYMREKRGVGNYIAGFSSDSINKEFGYGTSRLIYFNEGDRKNGL